MKRYFQSNREPEGRTSYSNFLLIGLFLVLICTPSQLQAQCPNGITNYWTFNNDNPGTTRDTIGSCDGSPGLNSSSAPAGQVGKASGFDGSRYVSFSNYPNYFWTSSLSVSLWCKFSDLSDAPMVMVGYDKTGISTHWWLGAEATTGRPSFFLNDDTGTGGGIASSDVIHDNAWHFLVATYNANDNSLRLYIDGDLAAEDTRSYSSPFTADSDLGMGAMFTDGAWKYHYTGLLDEVALYNRALSANEVNQLYNNGLANGSYCMVMTSKPEIISEPLLGIKLGDTYLYDVDANGTPDPTYSLKIRPEGMEIDEITGVISWDPTNTGTYNVLVEAMNVAGNTTQPFTIKVVDPCISGMSTYFTFEEGLGDITWDNANFIQGDLHNNPSWSPGVSGGGLTFNGTDQYLTISDDQQFYNWPEDNSFSFEFWCQSLEDQNELQVMLSRGTLSGTNWWFSTHSSSGYATFFLYDIGRDGGGIVGTTNINDGAWHHIVGIRDAATGYNSLYVDGKLEADSTFSYNSSFSSTTDPRVASFLENGIHKYFFDGTIDEIAIYDRALSSAEVSEHFTKGMNNYGYCSNVTIEPVIISKPVTTCYANQEYTYQVEALGVPAPTFNLTGAPSGLSINTFTGEISGKPTIPGEYSMTVTASGSGSDVQTFTLEVLASCIANTSFYFDFEEADGEIVYDVFSPREGHLINNPERGEGLVGNAIQFNGSDQRIFIPKEEEYDWSSTENFTIELWCLPGAVPEILQVMIGRDVPESTHWWLGTSSNTGSGEGIPVFYLFDAAREGAGIIGNKTIHDGNWHHLAVVREGDSGHTLLYVDGELQADSSRIYTNDFAADVNIQVANIYIDYQNKYFYEGKLDEIAIYKTALTTDEIRGHYKHGLTGGNYCDAARLGPFIILEPFH